MMSAFAKAALDGRINGRVACSVHALASAEAASAADAKNAGSTGCTSGSGWLGSLAPPAGSIDGIGGGFTRFGCRGVCVVLRARLEETLMPGLHTRRGFRLGAGNLAQAAAATDAAAVASSELRSHGELHGIAAPRQGRIW